jgi:voltage-gated potassium channel Kch
MPQVRRLLNAQLESRRFAVLLVALLLSLFVLPLLAGPGQEPLFFQLSVGLVLVAGLYAAAVKRIPLIVAAVLLLSAAYAWLGPDYLPGRTDDVLRLVTVGASLLFTAGIVATAIMRHDRVSRETLTGGINVYLLLVFLFALVHASIEVLAHGSYTIGGQALIDHVDTQYDGRAFPAIIYFSVTTLTTLGYGDIVPAGEAARTATSLEALVGQLYIAIFIGRLVGLQVGQRAADREAAPPAGQSPDEEPAA